MDQTKIEKNYIKKWENKRNLIYEKLIYSRNFRFKNSQTRSQLNVRTVLLCTMLIIGTY